jgi:hypothetical protein
LVDTLDPSDLSKVKVKVKEAVEEKKELRTRVS